MGSFIDLSLFPVPSQLDSAGRLSIAGHDLEKLADQHGTPLYLYDGSTIRHQVNHIQTLLKTAYPGESAVAYAAKAYFSQNFARKLAALGLEADVASLGELRMAKRAGFSPAKLHLHGNNKTESELIEALQTGVQAIVVDSLDELNFLEELAAREKKQALIWLRITPDLDVRTHPHVVTSHFESKFGLHIRDDQARLAIRQAGASRWLKLTGLHTPRLSIG